MKQITVGTYYAGRDQIELILREGDGGEFYILPEKGKIPRIKIGADYERWFDIVNVLLHEVYEFVLERMRCRYSQSDLFLGDHSSYLFMFSHVTFSEVNARVADFVTEALPELAAAWENWKKEK